MSININSNSIKKVVINGSEIQKIILNGAVVYSAGPDFSRAIVTPVSNASATITFNDEFASYGADFVVKASTNNAANQSLSKVAGQQQLSFAAGRSVPAKIADRFATGSTWTVYYKGKVVQTGVVW